jgi:outer membrane protein assembly factor BamB
VFARLGAAVTRGRGDLDFDEAPASWIVALDARAEGRLLEGFPIEPPSRDWAFDGTPVTDGQRLWVAMRRTNDGRAEVAVAAYDVAGGRLLWIRPLATAETVGRGRWEEATHNLLTLHQGTLYCNLNLGFVVAVEAATGRLLWLVRYPRRLLDPENPDGLGRHWFRDLTPVLAYHDMLVVAPADSDRLFALDAFSGQVLWCQPAGIGSDIVHLLGISGETLVASGENLYWIDVRSGRLRAQFPPIAQRLPVAARPSPRGYGRGLIAGKRILWPTHEALYLFELEPAGRAGAEEAVPAGQPRPWSWYGVEPGHLVPAEDRLLIAGARQLAALPW